MKLHKYLLALTVAAAAMATVSCDDDFDRPPVITPVATIEANTTILELKEQYFAAAQSGQNQMTEIGFNADGDSIIIGGYIVSNDSLGNIYQRVILEDQTSSIPIRVYNSALYESYLYGQELRINVTGLSIGYYSGWLMIGVPYTNASGNTSVGGMDENVMAIRSQVNGLPQKSDIEEFSNRYLTTIPAIKAALSNETEMLQWQSRLIKLEDVEFVGGGTEMWGTPNADNYTTRQLRDKDGNTLDISTSNKSKFVSQILPKGTGSITAILSYFRSDWQLVFSNPAVDCIGFETVEGGEGGDTPSTPASETIFSETFASGIGNFTINNVNLPSELSAIWKHDSQYKYMVATAYSQNNYASDSWLISPVISLKDAPAAFLSYDQALNYFTSVDIAKTQAAVAIREAGTTDWTTLTVPSFPSSFSWSFVSTGDIDLSAFLGKEVEIGFHYTSTASKAGTWELKNVLIKTTGNASTPSTPATSEAKFKKVTAITSGKSYVLMVDGKVGTAIAKNDSYGRFAMADPIAMDGDVVTTDASNGVTFTAVEGGYAMTDTYGRILGMDASHLTSFQLFTTQPADKGGVWTVTFNADGTAAIANVLNPTCNVVKSGTFTNIAPSDIAQYPTFTAPVLYEKVD